MTLEAFLARVYVDEAFRRQFLADPEGEALRAGLEGDVARSLVAVDREGLALAVASFARKRGDPEADPPGPAATGSASGANR